MNNKFNPPKYKYQYVDPHPLNFAHTFERQNYTRVLSRLNEQNEYLSHNMKPLIMQNLALKNKLYHQKDTTYRAKDYAQYDVEEQVRRAEYSSTQRSHQHKRLKTQQTRQVNARPRTWKMPANRQQPNQSVLKRPTIIEGLSESQFENEGEKNKSQNSEGKKGILLSKQVKKIENEKRKRQYQKQLQQEKQMEQEQRRQIQQQEHMEQLEEESFTPKKTQSQLKDNPEKHQQTKSSKPKKDNSPYLKATNPYAVNYTTRYNSPSKVSAFNNKTYLNYSDK